MPILVLLHSPLVGPLTWRRTADVLASAGRRVLLPSLAGLLGQGPPFHRRLAGAVAAAIAEAGPDQGGVVLVVHSGAGALVPSIVEATDARVAGAVFVDALLPHPGRAWFDTAPPELADGLRAMAVDGWLPPWHRWFPPGTIAEILPEEELRDRFVAELERLPLAWFQEPAPEAPGWPSLPCGYLQLSQAYEAEAGRAERDGWPVVRLPADHLAMLTWLDALADVVGGLADELVAEGYGRR
jgi:hypothetical protein